MSGRDIVVFAIGGVVTVVVFVVMWSLGAAAHDGDEMTEDALRRKDEEEGVS